MGRGSKFSIEVPLAPSGSWGEAAGAPETLDESTLVGASVLVIDDEADVREAFEGVLKQWGCRAQSAGSAQEARANFAERTIHVIVSDYRLREGQTGIDAIRSLKSHFGETIPALLITGDTAPDRLQEAAAAGYELLHKPLNPARLKVALAESLAGERA